MNSKEIVRTLSDLIARYIGVLASFFYSGANFALAFYLQKNVSPLAFGLFSLVQIFVQFGISISNGLFCSPIILATRSSGEGRDLVVASFTKANIIFSLFVSSILSLYFVLSRVSVVIGSIVLVYSLASCVRWFFRSVELADGRSMKPAVADFIYCLVVLCGTALLLFTGTHSISAALLVQAAGAIGAFAIMGASAYTALRSMWGAPWQPYLSSFREHGRWALAGVVTTEATANAHPYLIGAILGPAAFAPVAVVSLFFRPITIVTQALTQYERPKMAAAYANGNLLALRKDVAQFRVASLASWLANSLMVLFLLFGPVEVVGNHEYPKEALQFAGGLLVAIFLARSLRGAESAALQSAGKFRILAWTTIVTAPIAVIGVAIAIWISPEHPVFTLLGVLAGELVMCAFIRRIFTSSQVLTGISHFAEGVK